MEQAPETQVQFINYNSLLRDVQSDMLGAKETLKDIDRTLFKLSQDKNFHLTYENKTELETFVYTAKHLLKAIETYLD